MKNSHYKTFQPISTKKEKLQKDNIKKCAKNYPKCEKTRSKILEIIVVFDYPMV